MESSHRSDDNCELPTGWKRVISKNRLPGCSYYYNTISGECTWNFPGTKSMVVDEPKRSGTLDNFSAELASPSKQSIEEENLCERCQRKKSKNPSSFSDLLKLIAPTDRTEKVPASTKTLDCICGLRDRFIALIESLIEKGTESEYLNSETEPATPLPARRSAPNLRVGFLDSPSRLLSEEMIFRRYKSKSQKSTEMVAAKSGGESSSTDPALETIANSDESPYLSDFEYTGDLDSFTCPKKIEEGESSIQDFELESESNPTITLKGYVDRLWKFCRVSDATFIAALIYLVRLVRSKMLVLNNRNVYKALLAALIAAAKANEDATLSNRDYAKVGGIMLADVNRIEVAIVRLLRWRLAVPIDEWVAALNTLSIVCCGEADK